MSRERGERVEYDLPEAEFLALVEEAENKVPVEGGRPGHAIVASLDSIPESEPAWLSQVPASVRPSDAAVRKLEDLRRSAHVPHRLFGNMVLQSPGVTKILVEQHYQDFRRRKPNATERELFASVLYFRYFTTDVADGMTPQDARTRLRQPWRQAIIKSVVQDVRTLDDLVHYIAEEYEEFWKHISDPLDVNSQIAEILGYRRSDV